MRRAIFEAIPLSTVMYVTAAGVVDYLFLFETGLDNNCTRAMSLIYFLMTMLFHLLTVYKVGAIYCIFREGESAVITMAGKVIAKERVDDYLTIQYSVRQKVVYYIILFSGQLLVLSLVLVLGWKLPLKGVISSATVILGLNILVLLWPRTVFHSNVIYHG